MQCRWVTFVDWFTRLILDISFGSLLFLWCSELPCIGQLFKTLKHICNKTTYLSSTGFQYSVFGEHSTSICLPLLCNPLLCSPQTLAWLISQPVLKITADPVHFTEERPSGWEIVILILLPLRSTEVVLETCTPSADALWEMKEASGMWRQLWKWEGLSHMCCSNRDKKWLMAFLLHHCLQGHSFCFAWCFYISIKYISHSSSQRSLGQKTTSTLKSYWSFHWGIPGFPETWYLCSAQMIHILFLTSASHIMGIMYFPEFDL